MPGTNQHTPLLTIIMPVYNAEAYIERALKNILAQSFLDYEVLVLDALSTDGTISIIEQYQTDNPAIRVISEKDNGIYDAMNKGINNARGEWLYFMGSDDSFYNTTVLEDVSAHLGPDADMVYGDVRWMPGGEMETNTCTAEELFKRNINHQRVFYRRNLFEKYGAYKLKYQVSGDHELNIRFICNDAIRKKHLPILIADYHAGGFSANKLDPVFWKEWKAIFRENFLKYLPIGMMYDKLGWYSRYLIDRKEYKKALPIFCDVLTHRFNPGVVWLTGKHFFRSLRKDAS